MDRLAVLRTVHHSTRDHTAANHWMLTGFEGPTFNAPDNRIQRRPSMGSAVARLVEPRRPGMPPYVAVPTLRGGVDNKFHYAAYLGGKANPFIVEADANDAQFQVKNLTLPTDISLRRLEDRRRVLEAMDGLRRAGDVSVRDLDAYQQRAFEMLTGGAVARAFDMSAEPPALRDRYGRHTFGQSAFSRGGSSKRALPSSRSTVYRVPASRTRGTTTAPLRRARSRRERRCSSRRLTGRLPRWSRT